MSKRVLHAQNRLKTLGWPMVADGENGPQTQRAVYSFQRTCALGRALPRTGKLTMRTRAKLKRAVDKHGGRCSDHFRYDDFASKGNGWILGNRDLVLSLEKLRTRLGGPIYILSGYRDPAHNDAVGGASASQHLYGNAIDPVVKFPRNKADGLFSGIGLDPGTGLVRHVDRRDTDTRHNYTGASLSNPTVFTE